MTERNQKISRHRIMMPVKFKFQRAQRLFVCVQGCILGQPQKKVVHPSSSGKLLITQIDEALAGFANHIQVFIEPDDSITVIDDGRWYPSRLFRKKQVDLPLRLSLLFCTLEESLAVAAIRSQVVFTEWGLQQLMLFPLNQMFMSTKTERFITKNTVVVMLSQILKQLEIRIKREQQFTLHGSRIFTETTTLI